MQLTMLSNHVLPAWYCLEIVLINMRNNGYVDFCLKVLVFINACRVGGYFEHINVEGCGVVLLCLCLKFSSFMIGIRGECCHF